jgi:hypothetical protein
MSALMWKLHEPPWGRSPTCRGAVGAELGRSGTCPTIIASLSLTGYRSLG